MPLEPVGAGRDLVSLLQAAERARQEARIAALLRAGRYDDARQVLDARLDRRESPRDRIWRAGAGIPILAG